MYLRTKLYLRGFNDSRVISIKPKAEKSVRTTTMSLYILQTYYLDSMRIFLQMLLSHVILRLDK